jgi:hypothetical protein
MSLGWPTCHNHMSVVVPLPVMGVRTTHKSFSLKFPEHFRQLKVLSLDKIDPICAWNMALYLSDG